MPPALQEPRPPEPSPSRAFALPSLRPPEPSPSPTRLPQDVRSLTMTDEELPQGDPQAFDKFIQGIGLALHAKDLPPATRREWEQRRPKLRQAMLAAMGPFPEKPTPLDPQ